MVFILFAVCLTPAGFQAVIRGKFVVHAAGFSTFGQVFHKPVSVGRSSVVPPSVRLLASAGSITVHFLTSPTPPRRNCFFLGERAEPEPYLSSDILTRGKKVPGAITFIKSTSVERDVVNSSQLLARGR
jgi:hypothetical protein